MQEALNGAVATLGRPDHERRVPGSGPVVPAPPAEAAGDPAGELVRIGVRKVVLYRETVVSENGREPARPGERATVAAVLANPWVGTGPETDLSPQVAVVAPVLAKVLTDRLIGALGGADRIEAFGKAAVVGTAGEIEHAGALIHTPYFGNLVRDFLEGESIICFADTRADAGEALVVPMWHKTHAATRSHYQTVTARVPDAPRAGELVVIAAASTGPRPHARIGDRATDPVVTAEKLGVR
ncbi:amino acid synthesis family protein [Geodermatophilus sp. SYSU D00703]